MALGCCLFFINFSSLMLMQAQWYCCCVARVRCPLSGVRHPLSHTRGDLGITADDVFLKIFSDTWKPYLTMLEHGEEKNIGERNVGHLFLSTVCSTTFLFIQTSFECLASRAFAWLNLRFDRVCKKFISMHRQWNLFILHDWTTDFNTPFQCPPFTCFAWLGDRLDGVFENFIWSLHQSSLNWF